MFISNTVHEYTQSEECAIESDSPFIYMEIDGKKCLRKEKKVKYADKLQAIIDFALITINSNGIWNSQFFQIIIINWLLCQTSDGGGKNVYFFTCVNNVLW